MPGLLAAALTLPRPCRALTLYITSLEDGKVFSLNLVSPFKTTLIMTAPAGTLVDSLTFELTGDILYSNLAGEVHQYVVSSKTDHTILTGLIESADLIMDPGGTSFWVSDRSGNAIEHVSLNASHSVIATIATGVNNPQGLAFDNNGHLSRCRKCGGDLRCFDGVPIHRQHGRQ